MGGKGEEKGKKRKNDFVFQTVLRRGGRGKRSNGKEKKGSADCRKGGKKRKEEREPPDDAPCSPGREKEKWEQPERKGNEGGRLLSRYLHKKGNLPQVNSSPAQGNRDRERK